MNCFQKKFLIIITLLLSVSIYSQSSTIIKTNDISKTLEHVDKDTLVIFDLDDTVFYGTRSLYTTDWVERVVANLKKDGYSWIEALRYFSPYYAGIHKFSTLKLVDEKIVDIINSIKKTTLTLGLTSRSPIIALHTLDELKKFNISFSDDKILNKPFAFKTSSPLWMKDNTIFCSDNKKGNIVKKLVKKLQKRGKTISKVIMVDDSKFHIDNVCKSIEEIELDYVGIHYIAAKDKKVTFDNEEAKKELLEIFEKFLNYTK
jgi:hypothetical protein